MACAGDGDRPDRGDGPAQVAGYLGIDARVAGFSRVQVRYVFPVPGRADGAVDQDGVVASDAGAGAGGVRPGPGARRPGWGEQVPAACDGGRGDVEEGGGHFLGGVLARTAGLRDTRGRRCQDAWSHAW